MKTPKASLAERMRPQTLEDLVGQEHLLNEHSLLSRALRNGRVFPVIFWGPPGSGKTTLARLIGKYTQLPFRSFSAVTSGVKDLRQVIDESTRLRNDTGKSTILFVDEIHRFNKAQQDAFLPHVENGLVVLIGATTQNPSFEIIPPLLSRARIMILQPLGETEIKTLLLRALKDKERGLGMLDIEVTPDALLFLIKQSQGDARVALNNLEAAAYYVFNGKEDQHVVLDIETVGKAIRGKVLPYDKDGEQHYNLISAFHKSLRGSDAQASVYWLYRMLIAGEDALYICRRMIRFASEDIGMADPNALKIAVAAFDAWQKVGSPEGDLALAQCAVYLASAPKSNALYLAEKSVKEEIEKTGNQEVPMHIRNAPTALMKKAGYAQGYRYPHNYPGAHVEQEYLPEKVENRVYYRPTNRGFEREIQKRMREWKKHNE